MGKKINYLKIFLGIVLSVFILNSLAFGAIIYNVKTGDTIYSIAKRFGISPSLIKKANAGVKIKVGKKIVIPAGNSSKISRRYQKQQIIKQVINKKPKKQIVEKKQTNNKKQKKNIAKQKKNSSKKIANKKISKNKIAKANKTRFIKEDNVNLRKGASLDSDSINTLSENTKVFLISKKGEWAYVKTLKGEYGWVYAPLISKNKKYNNNIATNKKSYTRRYKLVLAARKYIGVRYRWGAAGNGAFDCSGFVMTVYKKFGINLPHSAAGMFKYGTKVSKGNLQVGDLVFFTTYTKGPSHVGIYIGNGKFIHASSGKHKGVTISSLSENYYSKKYLGARRLLSN